MYQHKPYGFLSPSSAPEGNKVFALDLLTRSNNSCGKWQRDEDPRDLPGLRAAGRLDADSTGLMLWSTDKNLVEYIIGQSSSVEKEYSSVYRAMSIGRRGNSTRRSSSCAKACIWTDGR